MSLFEDIGNLLGTATCLVLATAFATWFVLTWYGTTALFWLLALLGAIVLITGSIAVLYLAIKGVGK